MKKTMMYLPDELHAYLAAESAKRGVSMAEIAREAIGTYRTAREAPPEHNYEAIIGVIDVPGPPSNDAEHVDEILAEYYRVGGKWDQEHGLADSD
jgi:hypothetical protein